jgi:hypothetical protein
MLGAGNSKKPYTFRLDGGGFDRYVSADWNGLWLGPIPVDKGSLSM